MELLGLKHFPKLLALHCPEPDGVHLRIHMIKLFRFKSGFLGQSLLLGNGMPDVLHDHGCADLGKIPEYHGFHRYPHIDHLLDIIQA